MRYNTRPYEEDVDRKFISAFAYTEGDCYYEVPAC